MEPGRTSNRAIRAIGVLLILEVIGLVLLGGYEFLQVQWMGIDLESPQHETVEVAVFALFIPSAILTLLSALSFLFLQRRGWLLAAIAQGLSLAVSLWLYSLFQPGYVYPMDVEPYVRACSLWVQRPGEEARCIVPGGELSLDRLAQQPMDEAGAVHFLKFTDEDDLRPGARGKSLFLRHAMNRKESKRAFRAGRGRLARVGYFSRFVDALYSIALLARGRVPGESAAAASVAYERIMSEQERYRYHGRVLRQGGWIVLQYWLFYPFNDWRSGFFGANDHEADWEKVFIYLSESEGEISPEWVAYAAHNYSGDNLRRRWDDPEVEKVGEHPVIYVGAGSHASYYAPGEYLTELTLPLPAPLARVTGAIRTFWKTRLGQYVGDGEEDGGSGYFSIPFVDYARGDGLSVGEEGDRSWDEPRLVA